MNKLFFTIIWSLLGVSAFGQEMLMDLNSNARLLQYETVKRQRMESSRAIGDTLSLPFFDDFSEPFSRLRTAADMYPNPTLWLDDMVYINNHMAINPISQGVATFDGLNAGGAAYVYGFSLPAPSDSLTSKPIDLSAASDTVYISFYYQAQGMGNAPELGDSLVLEFKDTGSVWNTVWDVTGYTLVDFEFRRGMIPVLGERYLYNGFQFRFRNYSSRSGSVDHWHLDYIELDEGRNSGDTAIYDAAQMCQTSYLKDDEVFQNATVSILKEYSAMPWKHYKEAPETYTGDSAYFVIGNNFDDSFSPNFTLQIFDYQGGQVFDGLNSTSLVPSMTVCGNELNTCNSGTGNNFNFSIDGSFDQFPTTLEISDDTNFFELRFNLEDLNDNVESNNVRVEKQEFYNYYAYDDGTAELAYGLGSLENIGMVAMKFDIKMEDDLQAIQIYLNPVGENISQEPVNLAVWSGNEFPETLRWMSPDTNLSFTYGINSFVHYQLDTVLPPLSGNIFIGWVQQAAPDIEFSIGFDKRTDASDKLFYNLGTGWTQSSIPGVVMIRPSFGEPYEWIGVEENQSIQTVNVYPNPTTGLLHLSEAYQGQFRDAEIIIFDLTGRVVQTEMGYDNVLDLGRLMTGTYILQLVTETGEIFTQRIIVKQ